MDPSLRLRLREDLRPRAARQGWRELVAAHGTPLLVLDPDRVAEQYELMTRHLRGFRLRYRCIHTHPIKKPADIDHAYRAGIRTFVVDNPCEAQKFSGRPADVNVLVRLAFPNPTAKSELSTKFGVHPDEAELVVKHVVAAGVTFAGFSFHVGSQGTSLVPYRRGDPRRGRPQPLNRTLAGGACPDPRHRRRHAATAVRRRRGQPDDGCLDIGDVVAVQRHRRDAHRGVPWSELGVHQIGLLAFGP